MPLMAPVPILLLLLPELTSGYDSNHSSYKRGETELALHSLDTTMNVEAKAHGAHAVLARLPVWCALTGD